MNRLGDAQEQIIDRSSRLFEKDGYWYYKTRERVDIGPFDTYGEAELGVSEFIDFILHAEPEVRQTLERYGRAA